MKRVQIDRQIINHKILQATFMDLPAVEGWNNVHICVCVCVCFNSVPLLLHSSFCCFMVWSFTIKPSGSSTHDTHGGEKHFVGSKSVTALTKTCQCAGAVCVELHACAVWIADWKPWLLAEDLLCSWGEKKCF